MRGALLWGRVSNSVGPRTAEACTRFEVGIHTMLFSPSLARDAPPSFLEGVIARPIIAGHGMHLACRGELCVLQASHTLPDVCAGISDALSAPARQHMHRTHMACHPISEQITTINCGHTGCRGCASLHGPTWHLNPPLQCACLVSEGGAPLLPSTLRVPRVTQQSEDPWTAAHTQKQTGSGIGPRR